jgi:hypothetical protein
MLFSNERLRSSVQSTITASKVRRASCFVSSWVGAGFHFDFQFVHDAAKNAKNTLVRADEECLEVHMAIIIKW